MVDPPSEAAARRGVKLLRVVDFFCGIGGNALGVAMALASLNPSLAPRDCSLEVAAAIDVAPHAIALYQSHFPAARTLVKSIESVTPEWIDALGDVDCWLMSPPCQPFTRQGSRKGIEDSRSAALRHIVDVLLRRVKQLPRLLYLENVVGFESSTARDAVVSRLVEVGYGRIREYLVAPTEPPFGWINARRRYYMVASELRSSEPQHNDAGVNLFHATPLGAEYVERALRTAFRFEKQPVCVRDVVTVVSDLVRGSDGPLAVPERLLCRLGHLLDIVDDSATRTNCFTKNYGRKVEGAGSVYTPQPMERVVAAFRAHSSGCCCCIPDERKEDGGCPLARLGIRFFSPAEVGRFMGYPSSFFSDPASDPRRSWMLLGNSVNPIVVAAVLLEALESLVVESG